MHLDLDLIRACRDPAPSVVHSCRDPIGISEQRHLAHRSQVVVHRKIAFLDMHGTTMQALASQHDCAKKPEDESIASTALDRPIARTFNLEVATSLTFDDSLLHTGDLDCG